MLGISSIFSMQKLNQSGSLAASAGLFVKLAVLGIASMMRFID
jgi:NaMN:DMB phosphoribosyltransferase